MKLDLIRVMYESQEHIWESGPDTPDYPRRTLCDKLILDKDKVTSVTKIYDLCLICFEISKNYSDSQSDYVLRKCLSMPKDNISKFPAPKDLTNKCEKCGQEAVLLMEARGTVKIQERVIHGLHKHYVCENCKRNFADFQPDNARELW